MKSKLNDLNITTFKTSYNYVFVSDELGYLVDAIVSDEMIDSFDKRPNDMSIEVTIIGYFPFRWFWLKYKRYYVY